MYNQNHHYMYVMHTFVASTYMDMVHSDSFSFGDGFGYTYLMPPPHLTLANNQRLP